MPSNSSRTRNLLHYNKLSLFRLWATEAAGYVVRKPTGHPYEVLRLASGIGRPDILFYKRDRTDHVTTTGEGTKLVERWLKERKNDKPV